MLACEESGFAVIKLTITQGLLEEYPEQGLPQQGAHRWVVQTPFIVGINTVIPATSLAFGATTTAYSGPGIGIQPMAQPAVTTPLLVTLSGWSVEKQSWEPINLEQRQIRGDVLRHGIPEALWSKSVFDPDGIPHAKVIPDAIMGAVLTTSESVLAAPVSTMNLTTLTYFTLQALPLPLTVPATVPATLPGTSSSWLASPSAPPRTSGHQPPSTPETVDRAHIIAATIMDADRVIPLRNAILAVLRNHGQPAPADPNLSVLKHHVTAIFQAAPTLESLHGGQNNTSTDPHRQQAFRDRDNQADDRSDNKNDSRDHPRNGQDRAGTTGTQLIGTCRRYRANSMSRLASRDGEQTAAADIGLELSHYRIRSRWTEGLAASGFLAKSHHHQLNLASGNTSLLRLGARSSRKMQLTGTLPVRLCAFNACEEAIAHRYADPVVALHYSVPEETHFLAVMVVAPAQADAEVRQIDGWLYDSEWTRLNRYYFYHEHCLIRPEAAPVVKNKQYGQYLASTALISNQLRQKDGSVQPGWIETLFLNDSNPTLRTMTVLVKEGDSWHEENTDNDQVEVNPDNNPPRVQLCWSCNLANPAYQAVSDAEPEQTLRLHSPQGTIRAYVYSVPSIPERIQKCDATLAVLVHGYSAAIMGVLGFTCPPSTLSTRKLCGTMRCDAQMPAKNPVLMQSPRFSATGSQSRSPARPPIANQLLIEIKRDDDDFL